LPSQRKYFANPLPELLRQKGKFQKMSGRTLKKGQPEKLSWRSSKKPEPVKIPGESPVKNKEKE
jgi:hypothetical protein